MHDEGTVERALHAGGIVAAGAKIPKKGAKVGKVSARKFVHPALKGRTVVRLTTDEMAPGVDVEMETLGFSPPDASPQLGWQRYRVLGFPGWALVNDPSRAKFALDVMKELKKAAARVKSKPGHARDAFLLVAEKLGRTVPHFLPSFWEEVGRVFLTEDATTFAAQAFEKARTTEKEHALTIDEDVRAEVFLEFALAGAVNAKSLATYAKDLEKGFGPKEGYARFFELARRRTLGGMPPWTGMAKDLRAFAKLAKADVAAEDERFILETLDARALALAPAELWTTYRDALLRLGKARPEVRDRLRRLFPKPPRADASFYASWLALLGEAGALAAVTDARGDEAAREAHGMAADWLEKALAWAPDQPELAGVVAKMAPRLVAEGVAVQIAQGSRYWAKVSMDAAETALAHGVPLQPLPANCHIDLTRPFFVDPVTLAADPRFTALLANAVGQRMGNAAFEASAKGKEGLRAARRAWVEARIGEAAAGAVPSLDAALKQIASKTSALTFAEFPEAKESFLALEAHKNLGVHLRGGVFAELTWPALERAATVLGKGATLAGFFPFPVVYNASKVLVLGPDAFLLEHDLKVPAGARLAEVLFVPSSAEGTTGQLLVVFWDPKAAKNMAYWSGASIEPFEWSDSGHHNGPAPRVPGGPGITFGGRPLLVGDTRASRENRQVVTDGKKVWLEEREDGGRIFLREIDVATGQKGPRSWPAIMGSMSDAWVVRCDIQALPPGVTGSIYGAADGMVGGWVVRDPTTGATQYFGVDGRTRRESRSGPPHAPSPVGLVSFPGAPAGEAPRLVLDRSYYTNTNVHLHDKDERSLGTIGSDPWSFAGWPVPVPARFWTFLRPRDEAGSAALRAATDAAAEALLAAGLEAARSSASWDAAMGPRIAQELPAVTSPEVRAGLAGLVLYATSVATQHAALVKSHGEAAPGASMGVDDATARRSLDALVGSGYGQGHFAGAVHAASRYLAGEEVAELPASSVYWENLVGSARALAVRLMSAATSGDVRASAVKVLEVWKDTVFAAPRGVRVVSAHMTDAAPFMRLAGSGPVPSWLCSIDASRYFVRVTNLGALSAGTLRPFTFVERTIDGTFRDPPGVTIERDRRFADVTEDGAYLMRVLELFAARGAPPFDGAAADEVSTKAGLTRSEAVLLLAGLPNVNAYANDFLGKEVRAALDLKAADASAAREAFRKLGAAEGPLLANMAPAEPDGFYAPREGGEGSFVARAAAAWIAHAGKGVALREELVVLCDKELSMSLPANAALAALLAPSTAPCLAAPKKHDVKGAFTYGKASGRDPFDHRVASAFAQLIPFLFHALPVGDAYRDAIPALYEVLRARVQDPELLAPLKTEWGEPKAFDAFFDALGGDDVVPLPPNVQRARDGGAVYAELANHSLRVLFRPGKISRFEDEALVKKLSVGANGAVPAMAYLLESLPAFVARIASTPVPAGGYEANPALSAAKTVAAAKKALSVSAEAAMLYLQLLALAEPTSKSVVLWNGWKPVEYKRAAQELVAKELVVEGKRERAGREIFLPGAWEKKAGGDVPLEAWKLPLFTPKHGRFAGLIAPLPHHAMFEAAFARVVAGDTPKFEEV